MRSGTAQAHFLLGRYAEAASWAAMASQDNPDYQPGLRLAAVTGQSYEIRNAVAHEGRQDRRPSQVVGSEAHDRLRYHRSTANAACPSSSAVARQTRDARPMSSFRSRGLRRQDEKTRRILYLRGQMLLVCSRRTKISVNRASFPRAMQLLREWRYASDFPDVSNLIENVGKQIRQIETDVSSWSVETKKPATGFAARAL
jgi:hypothetical protein